MREDGCEVRVEFARVSDFRPWMELYEPVDVRFRFRLGFRLRFGSGLWLE